jgi:multimeric flavodoxin WrbA
MKIACVLGSPRPKGNSTALAKCFCDTAKALGAKVQTFRLNKLACRGCQACMACKTGRDKCILADDLDKVLEAVRHSDILVLASPVYYGDVSGQLKLFIDRTYSYLAPDYITNPHPSRLARGKKLVFILTQGQPDEKQFDDIFTRYNYFLRWYGFETHLIRACGVRNVGDVEAHRSAMTLAAETARKILA